MKKKDIEKAIREFATEERKREKLSNKKKIIEELFIKSREGIDHISMKELARRYFEGDEIEKNYVEAFYWVYKAEVLGNPDAPKLREEIEKVASDIQKIVAQKRLTEET